MGVDRVSLRAVFLDRDGVLNRAIVRDGTPKPPATLDEVEIPAEVPEALRRLRQAGFALIGVTNQPDVARGTLARETAEEINQLIASKVSLDEVRACYHDDADGCECRKPNPGMMLAVAEERGIDVSDSFMVGDRWRDVEAGRRAGCSTVLIDRGYADGVRAEPDVTVGSLAEAASWILAQSIGER